MTAFRFLLRFAPDWLGFFSRQHACGEQAHLLDPFQGLALVGDLEDAPHFNAARVNGFTRLTLTKLDVLTGFPEVRLAVAYQQDGERTGASVGTRFRVGKRHGDGSSEGQRLFALLDPCRHMSITC